MIYNISIKASSLFLIISFFSFLSGEINLYTHRHYNSDKLLFKAFTKKTGIKINVIKGSADQLIQRLQTEGENSPADILLTVDAGRLVRAKNLGLLQPVTSPLLIKQIPSEMRDLDGYWYGLTVRARALIYSKDRVKQNQLSTYEDLAHKKWRGRIVVRSSNNIYNQSLLASIIAAKGELDAYKWAKSVRSNMARSPRGSDRDQARAVASGLADVAIMNTYYLGVMANSSDKKDQDVVKKIAVFFPNQKNRGTHINVSGAGITKSSKNKEEALKFLEFLTNENSQKVFSSANYEYPLKINEHNSTILKSWGQFKYDPLSLSVLGEKNTQAVKIFDRASWE